MGAIAPPVMVPIRMMMAPPRMWCTPAMPRVPVPPAPRFCRLSEGGGADWRAVARLAGGDADRADGDVIGAGGQQRRGFRCGMRRDADEYPRKSGARGCGAGAARQMHAAGFRADHCIDIIVYRYGRSI